MNEKNERFSPIEEVDEILKELRDIKMGFIADEIIKIIQNGKTIEKKYHDKHYRSKKKKMGSMIVPFSKAEQIRITLKALYNYFIGLSELLDSSCSSLQSELQNENFRISILYPESEKEVELYRSGFYEHKDRFKELLLKGLNHYQNDYDEGVY